MTNREKVIKAIDICLGHGKCNDCPYCLSGKGYTAMNCRDYMLRDALALLKEQEPVKPILEQDSMVCGNCGHEVIWQKMIGDNILAEEQLDYCPQCGKAVKWE